MLEEKLERNFKKLTKDAFYFGNIELIRYFIFELDKAVQDLYRINNELTILKKTGDNFNRFKNNPYNY